MKDVLLSWDLAMAVLAGVAAWYFLPPQIDGGFVKDIYSVAITSLSIIFSVYFAALAIIMASSDDDFVHFLEEEGDYSRIIATFKFTLLLLFASLIASIGLYVYTSAHLVAVKTYTQDNWLFSLFSWLCSYALLSVFLTTVDAIRYAKTRSEFVLIRQKVRKSDHGPGDTP